jgi:hypothetical protein
MVLGPDLRCGVVEKWVAIAGSLAFVSTTVQGDRVQGHETAVLILIPD